MGNSAAAFPYRIEAELSSSSAFTVHSGVSNVSGDSVTVFAFDKLKNSSNSDRILAIRNCIKRLKILRHPNLLR